MSRPLVGVYGPENKLIQHVRTPAVFSSPVRPDVVKWVHTRMNKNKRQPYAVSVHAGMQHSAESWGTGRAVARIPRVAGGGTHRSGQGAFGNMCRGGRMFAPTKIWRRWHFRINVNQKRFAVCSALAASAVPALVTARGHRIENVSEIPFVVDNKAFEGIDKSKLAEKLLKSLNAWDDIERVKATKRIRPGKGKWRNRRYQQRRGPLIVYHEKGNITRAFRNIPGVDLVNVHNLNLLQLAPGGHLGRFIIWTKDAFEQLDRIFGTSRRVSETKTGYKPPRHIMKNTDIIRIMGSEEIQNALRPWQPADKKRPGRKNALRNVQALQKLDPYAVAARRAAIKAEAARQKKKAEILEAVRKTGKLPDDVKAAKAKKKAAKKKLVKKLAPYKSLLSQKTEATKQ